MQAIDRSLNGSWRLLPASLVVLGGRLPPFLRADRASALLDDGVDGLFQGARLGRGVWCLLPRSEHSLAELAELFAAERLTHLQQSVDAIALEVERISEAQRFIAKRLSERAESRSRKPSP